METEAGFKLLPLADGGSLSTCRLCILHLFYLRAYLTAWFPCWHRLFSDRKAVSDLSRWTVTTRGWKKIWSSTAQQQTKEKSAAVTEDVRLVYVSVVESYSIMGAEKTMWAVISTFLRCRWSHFLTLRLFLKCECSLTVFQTHSRCLWSSVLQTERVSCSSIRSFSLSQLLRPH